MHDVVVVSCPSVSSPRQVFSPAEEARAVEGGGGGRAKKGREERKREVRPGRTHRSRVVRCVGWEGQENRCSVVCGEVRQEGQRLSGALSTLSR